MKKWSFTQPLLFKLTTLALVVTLLSVGVTTFFIVHFAHGWLEERTREDLLSDAQMIQRAVDEAYLNPAVLEEKVAALTQDGKWMIRILDSEGGTLVDSVANDLRPEDLHLAELELSAGGVLQVFARAETSDLAWGLVRRAVVVGLLVALVAMVVAYRLNKTITNPINDLVSLVRSLQERQFGRMVLVRTTDEIGQLGRAFNELSETLEDLFLTISKREGQLDTVLSSMDDGVVAVNMRREVILANKAAADLFHLDPDEMIGRNQFEATRHEELSRLLEKTMDKRESYTQEMRLRPGSERTIAITSSPLDEQDGKIAGAVAVVRDITSLRHLEQMRQEFVANVSHELRTPLTSIKGFVETLLNSNLEDKELLQRFLGIIDSETDRMIGLINDLLDLSRIEGGKQPFHKASVDMRKVFDDTVLLLQSKAEAKNIKLENNIYYPMWVEGDEKLLKQVALNLVDNGVKYTPEGGRVWIEAEQGIDSAEFIVADNGLGIPSEHLDRLFERFYRVDKGRARHMGGTGLGLAITKHIIDKHKGSIAVESKLGKGTKIRITLKRIS